MAVRKFIFQEEEPLDYHLLAIHSVLIDYRLAFFLNKHLNIELKRAFNDLDISGQNGFYSFFQYENEDNLLKSLQDRGAKLIKVPESILQKMSYRDRPEGLVALSPVRDHKLKNMPIVKNGLYLVVEAIEKPGNLGSILRSADASGVNGLIVCDKCTDLYNPNVLRASTGAIFYVPIAECSSPEAIAWLHSNNIKTLAATPHAEKSYDCVDMTRSTAIVAGTEQFGLTSIWMKNSNIKTRIPMCGQIDSLNVAIATSILLFEAARQRRTAVQYREYQ